MSDAFDDESDSGIVAKSLPTPSAAQKIGAPKQKQGRPASGATAGAKVTKAASRRRSVETTQNKTTKIRTRPALKDISNTEPQDGNETEEVDDFDALTEDNHKAEIPAQQPTPASVNKAAPKPRGRKPKAAMTGEEEKPKRKGRKPAVAEELLYEIPETQPDVSASSKLARGTKQGANKPPRPAKKEAQKPEPAPNAEQMDVDEEQTAVPEPTNNDEEQPEKTAPAQRQSAQPPQRAGRSYFRQRQPSVTRDRYGRAGSASDTERGNDGSLRRKLQEMTQKCESLQMKYNTLRDVGVTQAEANFDKLKKGADEKTRAADELIARLRQDLAAGAARDEELERLRKRVASADTSESARTAEVKQLKTSLTASQNEVKSLQAKLSAARSASDPVATNGKAPSSALKTQSNGTKTVLVGSAEALKEAQNRKDKEELYRDLTGLIVTNVKKGEENEDVFDCIQTGRNGTLHFYLSKSNATSDDKTSNAAAPSYDDAEYTYTPDIDERHDQNLLAILPDYLTDKEGICFPQSNVAKFYSRIVDTMTKKIEIMEEE